MRKITKMAIATVVLGSVAPLALAQSSVTIYGVLDEFVGYQQAHTGGTDKSLSVVSNNGYQTSRLGFRGEEDLGGGMRTNFVLENGFDPSTGAQQNTFRLFDRQAWLGLSGGYGQIRAGRQNTPMWNYSGNMDAFNTATYGSGFNNFSQWMARVDNDISYFPPSFANTQIEIHHSLGEVPGNAVGSTADQLGIVTQQGPLYAALSYETATNPTNTNRVKEFMLGGNYDYGIGKIYVGYFRANEVVSATTGNALVSPGGKYDSTMGPVSNTPGNYHNTYSLSADYRITPVFTVGGGYSYMQDDSSLGNNASQFGVISTYDLSKRTRLYAVATRLINQNTAAYKMSGASTSTNQFLTPDAGHSETGIQFGIRHTF